MDPSPPPQAGAQAEGAAPVRDEFPSQYDSATGESSFDKVEKELRGQPLVLLCRLPDKTEVPIPCHVGNDVTYVKGQLARQREDIKVGQMKLFLDGNWMFDPLSLNDFPSIMQSVTQDVDQPIPVDVKVDPV